tara:strand:+ start:240 stop:629 length:390 start_codon:yes stop_codon:yes gene_type:complete
MKIISKIFGGALEQVSNVVDKFVMTKDEKHKAQVQIKNILIEAEQSAQTQVSSRWENDMKSDSWLSKNIRPLTLIFLTSVFVILSFFDGNIGEFTINEAYKPIYQTLLMVVYSAYFVGRSIEKTQSIKK